MHLPSSSRYIAPGLAVAVVLVVAGCTSLAPNSVVNGPIGPVYVPAGDSTYVWERIVEVLHDHHFTIARENRLEGVIETEYKPGASVLEPWHRDSVNMAQRWESTFQSIRRRVVITFQPAHDGGNFINLRVDKEIEDLPGLAANSAGDATFGENATLERDLNPVVGQSAASTWLPRGRDAGLEQVLNTNIRTALVR